MRLAAALLAFCLALAAGLPAVAQGRAPGGVPDPATLIADRVEIRADTELVAEGNVEVIFRGARLTARRIVYDRATDRLRIEGPITLTEGERVAIYADAAELSADLQDGILTSARLVLDQQLQFAAAEIARVSGRYTELNRVVASSCKICIGRPVPLWSIRARRVVHDQQERQIYFEGAQIRVLDVPVFYLPRLRFPDPTLRRATGFLFPEVVATSDLGTGIKVPYFIALGRSADLTVTPYLSPETTTLELRFRRAFRTGEVEIARAFSRDTILPGETRWYIDGSGRFELPRGFTLRFGIEAVSDNAYLLDYGYSGADRLESSLSLDRFRRDERIEAAVLAFHSLRAGEPNSTQPTQVGEARYERRFVPGALGGTATAGLSAFTARRTSDLDGAGRDVARLTASLEWERSEVFGPGLVATATARATARTYEVADDAAYPGRIAEVLPEAALTLRWPLARDGANGARQVLEPVAMLAWSPEDPISTPNEDSVLTEFDEANFLGFSRFPGEDARERGLRLALGLTWTRFDPSGRSMRLSFGRLFREDAASGFTAGSGLDGSKSDWLLGFGLDLTDRLDLNARALLDDDLSVTKADLRLRYGDTRFAVETGLLLLEAAPAENRPDRAAEWAFDASWRLARNWTARTDWRYDLEAERAVRAGIGLGWENDCLRVDLSLSRRFTSSTSVHPTTNFGLAVELLGFGTARKGNAPRRPCLNFDPLRAE